MSARCPPPEGFSVPADLLCFEAIAEPEGFSPAEIFSGLEVSFPPGTTLGLNALFLSEASTVPDFFRGLFFFLESFPPPFPDFFLPSFFSPEDPASAKAGFPSRFFKAGFPSCFPEGIISSGFPGTVFFSCLFFCSISSPLSCFVSFPLPSISPYPILISAPKLRKSLQIFSYPLSIKCLFLTMLLPSAASPATTKAAPPLNSSASTCIPFRVSTPSI